ncbi:MAG: nucleotidyltransferase domain-containing protein [Bryobacteraceae bacterium]
MIEEVKRRLIDFYKPVRIYLFGSAARGDNGLDSDLDLLVVLPDQTPKEVFRGGGLYRALSGIPRAVVISWRQTDVDGRAANVVASLPATVMREGRLLYDSSRMAV